VKILPMLLCTALVTIGIAALARAPYAQPDARDARLRFAWRMNLSAGEHCRPRTQAELDQLPVHMRNPTVCTSDAARYALVVKVDSAADTIHLVRGGVKGDRPVFVLEDRTIAPGRHHVSVRLVRSSPARDTVLAALDTGLTLRPGWIQLITLDPDGDRLIVRSAGAE